MHGENDASAGVGDLLRGLSELVFDDDSGGE